MAKRRMYISIGLMLLAILAIVMFQSYWLYKNYKEELHTLHLRTNVLMRDAVHQIQIENLTKDTFFVQDKNARPAEKNKVVANKKKVVDSFRKEPVSTSLPLSLNPDDIVSIKVIKSNVFVHTDPHRGTDTSVSLFYDTAGRRSPGVVVRAMAGRAHRIGDSSRIPAELLQEGLLRFPDSGTTMMQVDSAGHRITRTLPGMTGKVVGLPVYAALKSADSVNGIYTRLSPRNSQKARIFTNKSGGYNFIQILKSTESLKDTITIRQLKDTLQLLMDREKVGIPFHISRFDIPADSLYRGRVPDNPNEVIVGYTFPFLYKLSLENSFSYILGKLYPQVIVSFMLVGLTILSFVLLLRNLIQQQRLTQIKNDFISNITHELKTPIATVSVAIEALKNFNALNDPRRTAEYLDISENELQRLSLLVDKVLKLSMFEKQQIELRYEEFNIQELVDEVASSLRLQFEKYKAQFNVKLRGNDFTLKGDRLHITSVIYNLLDNALKYSKANPSIEIELVELAGEIEMSVTDNGIGISPEYKKKIFDKFFRVPTGDTHNVKGYGLGLSYVAYVVQRHNGQMEVESQSGIGSRFIIKLPTSR